MRTIDDDHALLAAARRFHEGEMTEKQLVWTLGEKGYTKEEIESAISDFHWIYVNAPRMLKNFLLPICVLCVLCLAALMIFRSITHP